MIIGAPDSAEGTSPTGTRIAFADSHHFLWVVNARGTKEHRVDKAYDGSPNWSPDGTEIEFSREARDSKQAIVAIHPDGTGRRRGRVAGSRPDGWIGHPVADAGIPKVHDRPLSRGQPFGVASRGHEPSPVASAPSAFRALASAAEVPVALRNVMGELGGRDDPRGLSGLWDARGAELDPEPAPRPGSGSRERHWRCL